MESSHAFLYGWTCADEAIRYKLSGYRDYSQGITEWDKGWNARLDTEASNTEELIRLAEDVKDGIYG